MSETRLSQRIWEPRGHRATRDPHRPSPTPSPGFSFCHLYTITSTIPSGFGVPWDVLSPAQDMLLKATCDASSVSVSLGSGNPMQYIYNTGYRFKTGQTSWSPISYTSTETLVSNAWYPKTANITLSMTATELQNTSYVLGYLCSWTGSAWKCGCRDSACTQSCWQIQSFKK